MSWIRELKVGDQFLDGTGEYVATVEEVVEGVGLSWSWVYKDRPIDLNGNRTYVELEEDFPPWTKLTPLIKELL